MKRNTSILSVLATSASLIFLAPALADDAHHPGTSASPQGGTGQTVSKPAEQTVKSMQTNVKKMQSQLERIAKAKTDGERQAAMAEHMQTMQENMRMAHGMQSGMMECPMMGKGMMGQGGMGMMMGSGGPSGNMQERMQHMEQRLEMMEKRMGGDKPAGAPADAKH